MTRDTAAQALQSGLAVESRVQGCADNLQDVTENLASGVDALEVVEQSLNRSRLALEESEAALAVSRNSERKANHLSMHDQKTGLPNRTLFDDRLAQAIAGAERHGWLLAVMCLDLDRFKLVNDTHGHAAGDSVLSAVAQRMSSHARDEDTVCRNGGDEFLYLLINPKDRAAVARIAGLVRVAIKAPIGLDASWDITLAGGRSAQRARFLEPADLGTAEPQVGTRAFLRLQLCARPRLEHLATQESRQRSPSTK